MMRTEQDLRAALAARERLSPDTDSVLVGVRNAARRRRWRTAGASAAVTLAVAAVIATPVLLVRLSPAGPQATPTQPHPTQVHPTQPAPAAAATVDPHAGDRPDFHFTVQSGRIAGYEIRPNSVSRDVQIATIAATGAADPVAALVLYRPGTNARVAGMFGGDPQVDPTAAPNTQVNGSPAVFRTNADWSGLRWEYAPNAQAVLGTAQGAGILPQQTLVEIAQGVGFVEPYPARIPFRLNYLPADLPLFHIGAGTSHYYSIVQFMNDTEDNPGAMDITITDNPPDPGDLWGGYASWNWQPATLGGRAARCTSLIDGRRCEVNIGEFTVSIGSGDLTPAQFDQIVAGIQMATVRDPATWFIIGDAIRGA